MSFGYFAQKYAADRGKLDADYLAEQIIIKGLYKVDEPPLILFFRTARLPAFADDSHPNNREIVKKRIHKSVNKSFSLYDLEQFYAMQLLGSRYNEETLNDVFLRMAFYMYIADKVSMHPNNDGLSFLAALRKAEFAAIPGDKNNPSRSELYRRFNIALGYLGLNGLESVLNSWFENNEFFVAGHKHSASKEKFYGHYTELARYLYLQNGHTLQVQDCVDYVYGNKQRVSASWFSKGFISEDAALLNHTKNMFFNKPVRDSIIKDGEDLRESDLEAILDKRIPVISDEEFAAIAEKRKNRLDKLKKYLAPEIMQIVINKELILIESTEKDGIANVYPQYYDNPDRLHGFTEEQTIYARNSRSISLTAYDLVEVSPGKPRPKTFPLPEGADLRDVEKLPPFTEDEELLHNACSFTHEIFHQITDWVYNAKIPARGEEIKPQDRQITMYNRMINLVNELSAKLDNGTYDEYKNHPSMTLIPQAIEGVKIWPTNMWQVINPTSFLYGQYYPYEEGDSKEVAVHKSNKRAEEVAANIFALLYTEMRRNNDLGIENNVFYSGEIKIPELKELVNILHQFMEQGLRISSPNQACQRQL